MGLSPRKPPSQLNRNQKGTLIAIAMAIAIATLLYIRSPLGTTKTTTERDQAQHVVKTVVEKQSPPSDLIILGGLGFAAILALTALLDGRLKLTAPGGGGIEVQAVVAAANATIEPLEEENERLRAELARARPGFAETAAALEDPYVAAARKRWKEFDKQLRGDG